VYPLQYLLLDENARQPYGDVHDGARGEGASGDHDDLRALGYGLVEGLDQFFVPHLGLFFEFRIVIAGGEVDDEGYSVSEGVGIGVYGEVLRASYVCV